MRHYEEYHELSAPWGWLLLVLLCLALIGWGLLNYAAVRGGERQWDYGALPETPASSVFTTSEPKSLTTTERQVEPLPDARPMPGQETETVKLLIAAGMAFVLGVCALCWWLVFSGPRMKVQAHVRAFQAVMPPTPAGAVPVGDPLPAPLTAESTAAMTNPLAPTPKNVARGKTYYSYYCVFCHGEAGDGRGPVGESYDPAPPDLRAPKVQSLPDGKLLLSSLTGAGHEPVLERVVPEKARWPIMLYVRSLGPSIRQVTGTTAGSAASGQARQPGPP